jgi:hypothetical protein
MEHLAEKQLFNKASEKQGNCEHGNHKNLCEICNKKTLEMEGEKDPEEWKTNNMVAKGLGVDFFTVKRIAENYRRVNPEFFENFKSKPGSFREYYSPQLVEIIRKEIEKRKEAPEGWGTPNMLAYQLNVATVTIQKIANYYQEVNPEYFCDFTLKTGNVCLHYAPQLVEIIRRKVEERKEAPENWKTCGALARELSVAFPTIGKIAEQYRIENPRYFGYYLDTTKKLSEHYSPELIKFIRNKINERKEATNGWITRKALAKELHIDQSTIHKVSEIYRSSNPGYFKFYLDKAKKQAEHFSPELAEIVRNKFAERKEAPENWRTLNALSRELGAGRETIERIADPYKKENPEYLSYYLDSMKRLAEHYSPELIEIIQHDLEKRKEAPEGWETCAYIAKKLNISYLVVKNFVKPFRTTNPDYFCDYKTATKNFNEHYSPELIDIVEKEIESVQNNPVTAGYILQHAVEVIFKIIDNRNLFVEKSIQGKVPDLFYRDKGTVIIMDIKLQTTTRGINEDIENYSNIISSYQEKRKELIFLCLNGPKYEKKIIEKNGQEINIRYYHIIDFLERLQDNERNKFLLRFLRGNQDDSINDIKNLSVDQIKKIGEIKEALLELKNMVQSGKLYERDQGDDKNEKYKKIRKKIHQLSKSKNIEEIMETDFEKVLDFN